MTARMHLVFTGVFVAVLAALGACKQQSFSLGTLEHEQDDRSSDASSPSPYPDASVLDANVEGAPSPLTVTLSARGREPVVEIALSCGAECVDVQVHVQGGVPPYEIVWDDKFTGAERSLCADPSRLRGGLVRDASDGLNPPQGFSVGAIDYETCTGAAYPSYRTCFPVESVQEPCPQDLNEGEGLSHQFAFDLGKPAVLGTRLVANFLVRGADTQEFYSRQVLGFSGRCAVQSNYAVRGVRDDQNERTLLTFDEEVTHETRYLVLDFADLVPLRLLDAGVLLDIESVVVCEYTYDL